MTKLHKYLLALSIAGSNKIHGAPTEESFGSDSTKFVSAPLDVLQSYYFRASNAIMSMPEASRLTWLEERDTADRAAWASQFHNGSEPLGEVVKAVMEKRGAYWDKPIQNMVAPPKPACQPQQPRASQDSRKQAQGQQQPPSSSSSPKKMKPGTTADALLDGKTLCPDYNSGKCNIKGPSCDKGLHKCAKVLRGGRPCGMSYHGAHNCRNP